MLKVGMRVEWVSRHDETLFEEADNYGVVTKIEAEKRNHERIIHVLRDTGEMSWCIERELKVSTHSPEKPWRSL